LILCVGQAVFDVDHCRLCSNTDILDLHNIDDAIDEWHRLHYF
jgi:hypothetical protein